METYRKKVVEIKDDRGFYSHSTEAAKANLQKRTTDSLIVGRQEIEQAVFPTYMIAHKLKKAGAPISFSITNIHITKDDIKLHGPIYSYMDHLRNVHYYWGEK